MHFHGDQQIVILAFVFVFGTVIGSFLNVCITRIPEDVSIVKPGSKCPKCGTPIKPYDNVPVFAWLWLRGKCRNCGQPISPMYPLVELATGLLFVGCVLEYGFSEAAVKWIMFTCLILVLAVTDICERMLPDVVTLPGIAVGLCFAALVPPRDGPGFALAFKLFHRVLPAWQIGPVDAVLGALFGSLSFWGLGVVITRLMARNAFGLGDVKMLAMIGAFMGLSGVFFTMMFGSLIGTVVGTSLIVFLFFRGWKRNVAERATRRGLGKLTRLRWELAKRYQLPMGFYLAAGALPIYLWNGGIALITWTTRMVSPH